MKSAREEYLTSSASVCFMYSLTRGEKVSNSARNMVMCHVRSSQHFVRRNEGWNMKTEWPGVQPIEVTLRLGLDFGRLLQLPSVAALYFRLLLFFSYFLLLTNNYFINRVRALTGRDSNLNRLLHLRELKRFLDIQRRYIYGTTTRRLGYTLQG